MNLDKYLKPLKALYLLHPQNFQLTGLTCLSLIMVGLIHSLASPQVTYTDTGEAVHEASSYIPDGHALIPIELANHESISALISNFGWVDLYSVNQINNSYKKGRKIVKKIRILRAPLDQNQFGIIVPEEFTEHILNFGPKYIAIINKQKQHQSEMVYKTQKLNRKILFGDSI